MTTKVKQVNKFDVKIELNVDGEGLAELNACIGQAHGSWANDVFDSLHEVVRKNDLEDKYIEFVEEMERGIG